MIGDEWMDKKPSQYLTEFLNFVSWAQRHYTFCCDEMHAQEDLTQDYLHSLELGEMKCRERSKIATKLAENRRDRRYYKDRIEELEAIIRFFEDPQNKKMLDKLAQVLGQVRKAEAYHQNRAYVPRVLREKKE
jgi:hypothetical protein